MTLSPDFFQFLPKDPFGFLAELCIRRPSKAEANSA